MIIFVLLVTILQAFTIFYEVAEGVAKKWPDFINQIAQTQLICFLGFSGLILSSNQFSLMPQLPPKMGARFKSGQNQIKNNHLTTLILIRETHSSAFIQSLPGIMTFIDVCR
jgi:hypothetical protein